MALLVYDGFDHYAGQADLQARSGTLQWSIEAINNIFAGFTAPAFGSGKAISWNGASFFGMSAVLSTRNTTIFAGMRIQWDIQTGGGIALIDSVSGLVNVTVVFNHSNFSISVYRGAGNTRNGTLLYASNNNVWTGSTWNFVEVGCVFATGTGGSLRVRINNHEIITLTGISTVNPGGTPTPPPANAWCDRIAYYVDNSNSSPAFVEYDDFYACDGTLGPGPNPYDDFLGDARVVTLFAIGDDAVQFTPFLTSETVGNTTNSTSQNVSADTLTFYPFTVRHAGTLAASMNLVLSNALTGHVVLGIYDDSGPNGAPGALVASSSPLTNPGFGANVFTMGATTSVQTNVTYYFALLTDAVMTPRTNNIGMPSFTLGLAYTVTLPSSVTSSILGTTTLASPVLSVTSTIVNAGNVSEISMDGDVSYNFSQTVGNEDLLNFQALPSVIDLVIGLQLTGAYRKDDAGTRAVKQALKSGATELYGATNYLPTTTYVYFTDLWVLDPDTSMPWLATAVNALAGGYNVAV